MDRTARSSLYFVFHMKMRRIMLIKIHKDNNPKEAADFWHVCLSNDDENRGHNFNVP
jgi:hypothetical protein